MNRSFTALKAFSGDVGASMDAGRDKLLSRASPPRHCCVYGEERKDRSKNGGKCVPKCVYRGFGCRSLFLAGLSSQKHQHRGNAAWQQG